MTVRRSSASALPADRALDLLDASRCVEAADELAKAFSALAEPVRLRLLSLVAETGEVRPVTFKSCWASRSRRVSHHTKILYEAGLISSEEPGRWVR